MKTTSMSIAAMLLPFLAAGAAVRRNEAAAAEPAYVWASPKSAEKRAEAEPAYVWASSVNAKRAEAEAEAAVPSTARSRRKIAAV